MLAIVRSLRAAPRLACAAAGTSFSSSFVQATRTYSLDTSTLANPEEVLHRDSGYLSEGERVDLLVKFLSEDNMSRKESINAELTRIREAFAVHPFDTGSTSVQVALLTRKIQALSEHLQVHKKDVSSRRGLTGLLSQRKRLLKYIRKKEPNVYQDLILRLGMKDRSFVGNKYVD